MTGREVRAVAHGFAVFAGVGREIIRAVARGVEAQGYSNPGALGHVRAARPAGRGRG
jgi:hypothetical protein